ncbi:MAG TPA: hypothetical protein VGF86_14550 [Candidatus Tumulicola sp.]|jgi:hypothetical protein
MELRLARLTALFSLIAALTGFLVAGAGFWTAYEAQQQTRLALDESLLDKTGVVTRECDMVHRALMRTGDDLFLIDGAFGDSDYIDHEERGDLLETISKTPTYYLECRLKNPTRVPIFNLTFYSTVSYHNDTVRRRRHNDDAIQVLEPGETRTIWVLEANNARTIFHEPDFVEYYLFPAMNTLIRQALLPRNSLYWTIKRSQDPTPSEPM